MDGDIPLVGYTDPDLANRIMRTLRESVGPVERFWAFSIPVDDVSPETACAMAKARPYGNKRKSIAAKKAGG